MLRRMNASGLHAVLRRAAAANVPVATSLFQCCRLVEMDNGDRLPPSIIPFETVVMVLNGPKDHLSLLHCPFLGRVRQREREAPAHAEI